MKKKEKKKKVFAQREEIFLRRENKDSIETKYTLIIIQCLQNEEYNPSVS